MSKQEPWDEDPLNSSDFEFEAPETTKASTNTIGQESLEKIIEAAQQDRYTTKKTAKQLEYGHGSPGTRYQQQLWVARFNTFRKHALQKSADSPPSGDDIIRFIDGIIDKITPGYKDKPAINLSTMVSNFKTILDYSTFTYVDFKFSPRDGKRIKTLFDDCVRSGRLTQGLWKKKVWISFMILARLVSGFLNHYLQHGTTNWDITIARVMSVVLVASIGCRSGDVSRSRRWTGMEYLQWRHIELVLEDNGSKQSFADLRVHITLEYTKGYKETRNASLDKYIRPLADDRYRHVCPITWLLIHAMRHGLVRGSSIDQVLTDAAARNDRRVIWIHPDWPVCAMFQKGRRSTVHLNRTATPGQLLQSIKTMGLLSNILTRVYMHGTRAGHAVDLAHLPVSGDGQGFVTSKVRQSLGHSNKSFQNGITERYAGNPTGEIYNDIAKNEYVNRFGPKFSQTSALQIINAPVSEEEVAQYQREHEPNLADPQSGAARTRARRNIRRKRHQIFLNTAEPEPQTKGEVKVLAQMSPSKINIMHSTGKSDRVATEDSKPANLMSDFASLIRELREDASWAELSDRVLCQLCKNTPKEPWVTSCLHLYCKECLADLTLEASELDPVETACRKCTNAFTESQPCKDTKELKFLDLLASVKIDPRLLDKEEDIDDTVDDGEMAALGSAVFLTEADGDATLEEAALESLFLSPASDPEPEAIAFITRYSKINIIKNASLTEHWRQWQAGKIDGIEEDLPSGNSRDEPTPFEFLCTKSQGCAYSTIRADDVVYHEMRCSPERVEKDQRIRPLQCTWPNCQYTTATKTAMSSHISDQHRFSPRKCPHDACHDQSKIYTTQSQYQVHMAKHNDRFPRQCSFPDCPEVKSYKTVSRYSAHLVKSHHLQTPEERQPYLPEPKERMVQVYNPSRCPQKDCVSKTFFATSTSFKKHLQVVHSLSPDQAKEITVGFYESITTTERTARRRALEDANEQETNTKTKKSRL